MWSLYHISTIISRNRRQEESAFILPSYSDLSCVLFNYRQVLGLNLFQWISQIPGIMSPLLLLSMGEAAKVVRALPAQCQEWYALLFEGDLCTHFLGNFRLIFPWLVISPVKARPQWEERVQVRMNLFPPGPLIIGDFFLLGKGIFPVHQMYSVASSPLL